MKRIYKCIAAFIIGGLLILSAPLHAQMINSNSVSKSDQFRLAMNKLWEDHITWTRNVIFCLVDDLPGADQAVKRLLNNQDDIGNAIKPYYGEEAGKKLTGLLHDHITISADVVKAAKAANTSALNDANERWFDNADEISLF